MHINLNPQSTSGVLEPGSLRARLIGTHNTNATKTSTTTHDWDIPQEYYQGVAKSTYFDGIQYYVKDAEVGDSIIFQIVDKTGAGVSLGLYPQEYYDAYKDGNGHLLVEEFGDSWFVVPNSSETIKLYKARLIPGLAVRVIYTSTGTVNDPKLICNLFRHLDGNS